MQCECSSLPEGMHLAWARRQAAGGAQAVPKLSVGGTGGRSESPLGRPGRIRLGGWQAGVTPVGFPQGRKLLLFPISRVSPMRHSSFSTSAAGPLQKLLTLVVGVGLIVLGLMFSAVVLVAGVVIGLMVWGYMWWKTRDLRRAMRAAQAHAQTQAADRRSSSAPPFGDHGDIIEGEAVVVETTAPKRPSLERGDDIAR